MSHSPEQMRKKAEAMRQADHHFKNSNVDGSVRVNDRKDLYDYAHMTPEQEFDAEDKSIKLHGREKDNLPEAIHRSVLDERQRDETIPLINQIPKRK